MRYWFGVSGSKERVNPTLKMHWFCVPESAEVGDSLYLYIPRSASARFQGVFCQCEIISLPSFKGNRALNCAGYGNGSNKDGRLGYSEIRFLQHFKNSLTAKEMKEHISTARSGPVKRNFQFTCMELNQSDQAAISKLIQQKNLEK